MSDHIEWTDYAAVLFDLDGVLTPTAEMHERAWAEMFNRFLGERSGDLPGAVDTSPFTDADYLAYVDGKPRYDGVRSFLESRGIELAEGSPSDPPGHHSVCALGNRKNETFNEIIARDGIDPYPGSVRLLDHLESLRIKLAVVSSSKNARGVLGASALKRRFSVIVDGIVVADRGLAGKPAPDAFLLAASELGVDAAKTVVVEDAVSGVQAGRAGGFALVIGVDRGAGTDALRAGGADLVVEDPVQLVPVGMEHRGGQHGGGA